MAKNQPSPNLLKARSEFTRVSGSDYLSDRQKQAFIAKYCQLLNSNRSRQEKLTELQMVDRATETMNKMRVFDNEKKRTEFQRAGKRYEANVKKQARKDARPKTKKQLHKEANLLNHKIRFE